jgi:hypothetical protein
MDLETLIELVESSDLTRCKSLLDDSCLIAKSQIDAANQYVVEKHKVNDKGLRQDKVVFVPSGQTDTAGEDVMSKSIVKVARLTLPVQKDIVRKAAAFLGSPTLETNPAEGIETDMATLLDYIHEANKLVYRFKKEARTLMSECEVAELWYTTASPDPYPDGINFNTKVRFNVRILSRSNGDSLYPVFDQFDDLIAFGRYYNVPTVVPGSITLVDVEHFDIYTADQFYFAQKQVASGTWFFWQGVASIDATAGDAVRTVFQYADGVKAVKNPVGKIPVIYGYQHQVEWHDVQTLIDRLETKLSNHADTNDYFDAPIAVAKGKVLNFALKGEAGKMVETDVDGSLEYLTWDNAPESMKMEIENLRRDIAYYTQTPDISFEKMQGLGTSLSGFAIRLMFMDPIQKAKDKEEIFGEFVQRRINYLKAAIAVVDTRYKAALGLKIKPKFTTSLPMNDTEEIANINAALAGGFLSKESAIEDSPLTKDAEAEKERIAGEAEDAAAKAVNQATALAAVQPAETPIPEQK